MVAENKSKPKLCLDRRQVGQSVLVTITHLWRKTKFLLLSDKFRFVDVGALTDERTDVSLTAAAGHRQCSHFRVRVPHGSWPYFTATDSRLHQTGGPGSHIYIPPEQSVPVISPRHRVPISSPPTTRRDTVGVLGPASTRRWSKSQSQSQSQRYITTGDLPPTSSSWR
jgi:hypothetical protein